MTNKLKTSNLYGLNPKVGFEEVPKPKPKPNTIHCSSTLQLKNRAIILDKHFFISNEQKTKTSKGEKTSNISLDFETIEPFLDLQGDDIEVNPGITFSAHQIKQLIIAYSHAITMFVQMAISECLTKVSPSVDIFRKGVCSTLKKSDIILKVNCDDPTIACGLSSEFLSICSTILKIKPKDLIQETAIPPAESYDVFLHLSRKRRRSICASVVVIPNPVLLN
jgi:hypothetical protein